MTQYTNIKKTTGLEDTFSGYDGKTVESKGRIEVIGSGNLNNVLADYSNFSDASLTYKFKPSKDMVLTPCELNRFIGIVYNIEDSKTYRFMTHNYFSYLIKISYRNGKNNNFLFDQSCLEEMNGFAGNINASKERPLIMDIQGNVGPVFGSYSENLIVSVDGNVRSGFCSNSRNILANIKGDVRASFGLNSRNLNVKINGEISIKNILSGATGSIIEINDKVVLKKLLRSFKKRSLDQKLSDLFSEKHNSIVFIDNNGKRKLVKRL